MQDQNLTDFALGIVEWWAGFIAAISVIAAALWRVWTKVFKPLVEKTRTTLSSMDTLVSDVQIINNTMIEFTNTMEHLTARQWSSLDTVRTAIVEKNTSGELIRANRAYLRMVDRQIFDLTGNGWIITIHPDDREKIVTEWKRAVEEERGFEARYRVQRPDGTCHKVFCVASPMRRTDGKLIGWLARIEETDTNAPVPSD